MLHGCQKKIYHVKNVGGKYFDEAYLVLRDDLVREKCATPGDLAAEADRIIREASSSVRLGRKRHQSGGMKNAVMFALGALSSSAVIGTAALIFFCA